VRYFSTRRFVGEGTIEKREIDFVNSNIYLPCLPKERPFVAKLSDGLLF
jgi:hypothetical protein